MRARFFSFLDDYYGSVLSTLTSGAVRLSSLKVIAARALASTAVLLDIELCSNILVFMYILVLVCIYRVLEIHTIMCFVIYSLQSSC